MKFLFFLYIKKIDFLSLLLVEFARPLYHFTSVI